MKWIFAMLFFTPIVCGCRTTSTDLLREASESEFGDATYGCFETVEVAKTAGYDYEKVVAGCLRRDEESMHQLFWLSANARFDAASSQGHSTVMGAILRRLGDRSFGTCLSKENEAIQDAVREDLLYDLGVLSDGGKSFAEVQKKFPTTFPKDF